MLGITHTLANAKLVNTPKLIHSLDKSIPFTGLNHKAASNNDESAKIPRSKALGQTRIPFSL